MNHIDLSGMDLNGDHLLFLAKQLARTSYLCVVHLNNNNITQGPAEIKNELLDIFGIQAI